MPGSLTITPDAPPTLDVAEVPLQNEKKTLTLSGWTSGNFTITFQGQTTGNIAYNADAATVQTALEALSNVDSGDVTCTDLGLTGDQTLRVLIEFAGQYAGVDLPSLTLNNIDLATDGSISGANTQNGISSARPLTITPA